ncbi:YcxB family protein [Cerasicoccus maritimus]|uniref:YcxB family protein n=1 Tax=Cerasicoccus maritimus TaxID=490089 RepID=UPI0028525465|nr:YcxB family protein [Cerasicoccus maritimus]
MNYSTTYTVSEALQQESLKQYFFKVMLGKRRYALVLLVIFSVTLFFTPTGFGMVLPVTLSSVTLVCSLMWVKAYFSLLKHGQVQLSLMGDAEVKVELDETELRYQSSVSSRTIPWDKIESMKDIGSFIVLLKGKTPLVSLPKDFFAAEAREFIQAKVPQ